MKPKIAIVMGSKSDWETLCVAGELLTKFGIRWHAELVSAPRTSEILFSFANNAKAYGVALIIPGAWCADTEQGAERRRHYF